MISEAIVDKLNSYDQVILAVSGGSDSMAMLSWFIANYDITKYCVINVEHGIRGEQSCEDSRFVAAYCKQHGVTCHCYSVKALSNAAEHKLTVEQSARLLRRDCYSDAISKYSNAIVATAHHAADQTETILMNIFRGSGLKGVCGMSLIAHGGIIHPLLYTAKSDIMSYIASNNVPYRNDESNGDIDYRRNYMRAEIVPRVAERYGDIDKSIARLAANASDVLDYINSSLPHVVWRSDGIVIVQDCHRVIFAEQVRRACRELGVYADIEWRHIELINNLKQAKGNSSVDLPSGLVAYREYGDIVIAAERGKDNSIYPISAASDLYIGGNNVQFERIDSQEYSSDCTNGSCLLVPQAAVIRTRREGDYIIRKGGRRSLSRYMIDINMPPRLRENYPLIAVGSQVLAVIGIEVSESIATSDCYMIKASVYSGRQS